MLLDGSVVDRAASFPSRSYNGRSVTGAIVYGGSRWATPGRRERYDFHKRADGHVRPELQGMPTRLVPPPTHNRQGSPLPVHGHDLTAHVSILQDLFQHSPTNGLPARWCRHRSRWYGWPTSGPFPASESRKRLHAGESLWSSRFGEVGSRADRGDLVDGPDISSRCSPYHAQQHTSKEKEIWLRAKPSSPHLHQTREIRVDPPSGPVPPM